MLLLNRQAITTLDRQAVAQVGFALMAAAGKGLADFLGKLKVPKNALFGFVCGKGNNGGDGLVAARHLHAKRRRVLVIVLGEAKDLKGDAQKALNLLQKKKVNVIHVCEGAKAFPWLQLQRCAVIVDGIFGTGLDAKSGRSGTLFSTIQKINEMAVAGKKQVVAIDIPSGLDADTGVPVAGKLKCIRAHHTVTMGYAKPGLWGDPGCFFSGDITVIPLPYPKELLTNLPNIHEWVDGKNLVLRKRAKAAHKGQFGHAIVIGGSARMPGALQLCVEAALSSGVGKVTAICPGNMLKAKLLKNCPEAMWRTVQADAEGFFSEVGLHESLDACEAILRQTQSVCVVMGPGMGQRRAVWKWVEAFLALQQEHGFPLVLDADALNAWSTFALDRRMLREARHAPVILTPHVAELARLLKVPNAEVAAARHASVTKATAALGAWVILKGYRSLLAGHGVDDATFLDINASGNPGMAKPGMGDVLSGALAARLAGVHFQKADWEVWRAVLQMTVYVHGRSGDLAAAALGEEGLRAQHVIDFLPRAWKERSA